MARDEPRSRYYALPEGLHGGEGTVVFPEREAWAHIEEHLWDAMVALRADQALTIRCVEYTDAEYAALAET